MIYKNGKLIVLVQKDLLLLVNNVLQLVLKNIGAIYKGTDLVWLTIYNAIKSCFGSGIWLSDKPWLDNDTWKHN